MADRSLRGMRLGSQSFQSEEGVEFSPRKKVTYQAEDGGTFEVVFAEDAEVPERWENPRTGIQGRLIGEDGKVVPVQEAEGRAPRTHWDMLLERRTRPELEEILQERLEYLRARRGETKPGRKSA